MLTLTRKISVIFLTAGAVALPAAQLSAQETVLLWGDTHLHTSHSTDAYSGGNYTTDPDQAYRYAKGMPVIHPITRARVQIPRPLDFLVVADHSDYLGLQVYLEKDDPRLTSSVNGRRLQEMVREDPTSIFRLIFAVNGELTRDDLIEAYEPVKQQPWLDEIVAAETHNEPGIFTAFAGWEWSSHEQNRNLHRVVFSPSSPDQLASFFPFSNLESTRPEDLWQWLEDTEAETGTDFVAIPHNSNMSTGLMFDRVDSYGRSITAEYARTRMRWEPVMEITQAKGTSEVHPELSPNDEFAEFEIFRRLFFAQEPEANGGDYARSAFLRGLEFEQNIGVNPYKLGVIGSSDIHTGLATLEENDFQGAVARDILPETRENAPRNRPANQSAALNAWELSASGLAGVWARENTRESISEAFKRKEVYATSGPRMALRTFGGFNFQSRHADSDELVKIGYDRGVPMGGDVSDAPRNRAFSMLIQATKDPIGANLDRVQVIKGWVDASGSSHEAIYNVAWSGNRELDANGNLPPVGNTVDIYSASYENSIGNTQLATVWQDPDFDPDQRAFYYVRALEIPTPRHQVYDAVALGIDPADTQQALTIQERAWSSPIWYTP